LEKKAAWGFKLIKKLSPERSVFKPIFKLVVILLALTGFLDW
jgi:Ca-activated chloride channel family protein